MRVYLYMHINVHTMSSRDLHVPHCMNWNWGCTWPWKAAILPFVPSHFLGVFPPFPLTLLKTPIVLSFRLGRVFFLSLSFYSGVLLSAYVWCPGVAVGFCF